MTHVDQRSPASMTLDEWEPDGDHALRHSTGWTIARYKVDELRVYLLWSPVGKNEVEKYGPFASAEAAKRRHAELIDPSQSSVVQDASQKAANQKTIGHAGEKNG